MSVGSAYFIACPVSGLGAGLVMGLTLKGDFASAMWFGLLFGVFGTPIALLPSFILIWIGQRAGWQKGWVYSLLGALAAFIAVAMLSGQNGLDREELALAATLSLGGAIGGYVLWYLSIRPRGR